MYFLSFFLLFWWILYLSTMCILEFLFLFGKVTERWETIERRKKLFWLRNFLICIMLLNWVVYVGVLALALIQYIDMEGGGGRGGGGAGEGWIFKFHHMFGFFPPWIWNIFAFGRKQLLYWYDVKICIYFIFSRTYSWLTVSMLLLFLLNFLKFIYNDIWAKVTEVRMYLLLVH